jgi:putative phage-type endonuclease
MSNPTDFSNNRQHGIGGSDIAALLGLSPYMTPLQLWAEKVGHPGAIKPQGIHLRYGHHLEPFVASEYEMVSGLYTHAVGSTVFHPDHGFMFANIDRLVTKNPDSKAFANGRVMTDRLLECKTSSVFSRSEWGIEGTDQVPTSYLLQCAWYMAISGCSTADIAVLIGNSDFRVYTVRRNTHLEALMLEQANSFWHDHVLSCVPPPPQNSQDALILFPKGEQANKVEADDEILELLERYENAIEEEAQFRSNAEDLRAQLMSRMGKAQEITRGGNVLATWRSSRPTRRLDVQALKFAHPEIAEKFMLTSTGNRRFVLRSKL